MFYHTQLALQSAHNDSDVKIANAPQDNINYTIDLLETLAI